MVLLIIIPFFNGYFIGNINILTQHFQTNPDGLRLFIASHGFSVSIYLLMQKLKLIKDDKKMIKDVMLSLSCGSLRFSLCSCIHCTPVESSARPGRGRRGRRAQRRARRVAGPRCTWHWQIHRTFRGSERRLREVSRPGRYRDLWNIIGIY